jgi:hypothetical protein
MELPHHIWLTYNDPRFDRILPALPKMYLFSYQRGTSFRPWFVEDPVGCGERISSRQYLRAQLRLPLSYRYHVFEPFVATTTLNLSGGGVLFRGNEAARRGADVELEITLSSSEKRLRALGRVTRVHRADDATLVGVQFTEIDVPCRLAISDLVGDSVATGPE